jgi:DNA processing protein
MGQKTSGREVFDTQVPYYPSNALSLDELSYWIAFSRVFGIGPVRFKALLDFFEGDVAAAWHADNKALAAAGIEPKIADAFLRQRATIIPHKELERLERLRIRIITWKDTDYPPLLKRFEYAPPVLYMCGTLTEDDRHFTLAIVGTRKMSTYGRQVTERFAGELARGKMTVISGLAVGIDTVAHTSALTSVIFYAPYRHERSLACTVTGARLGPQRNEPCLVRLVFFNIPVIS